VAGDQDVAVSGIKVIQADKFPGHRGKGAKQPIGDDRLVQTGDKVLV